MEKVYVIESIAKHTVFSLKFNLEISIMIACFTLHTNC